MRHLPAVMELRSYMVTYSYTRLSTRLSIMLEDLEIFIDRLRIQLYKVVYIHKHAYVVMNSHIRLYIRI